MHPFFSELFPVFAIDGAGKTKDKQGASKRWQARSRTIMKKRRRAAWPVPIA
jgi:hypothetical protein